MGMGLDKCEDLCMMTCRFWFILCIYILMAII